MRALRNGGAWLLLVSTVYLIWGMYSIYDHSVPDYASLFYVLALSFPFWMPSFGRWLFMDVTWDLHMIDFFKKKKAPSNVVPFPDRGLPEPKSTPPMPYVKPVETQREHYRVGSTIDGGTTLTLIAKDNSQITLTMNNAACLHLIKMLECTFQEDNEND